MSKIRHRCSEQRSCIESGFCGENVFGSFPASFGKSLIFQALPIVAAGANRKSEVVLHSREDEIELSSKEPRSSIQVAQTLPKPRSARGESLGFRDIT